MAKRPDLARRHRERSDLTRRHLLDAAREVLEKRPFHSLTISELTDRAGLSRTAFYRHFTDLAALLSALLAELGGGLDQVADLWEDAPGDDPAAELRPALERLVQSFADHGRLLHAIVDASPMHPEIAEQYSALGEQFARTAAERIRRDVAAGRSQVRDPEEIALALVWLNERYLLARFGRRPLGDPERTTDTLVEIWTRTVYGRD